MSENPDDILDDGEVDEAAGAAALEAAQSKMRRLMELRVDRDEKKVASEKAEKAYRAFESEVWDWMEESPLVPPIRFNLGEPHGVVRFQPRETYYGRVIDQEAALEYLEERALVDEFTKPKLVMARVNEIVRERIEAAESQPPGFDFYAKRFITITVER